MDSVARSQRAPRRHWSLEEKQRIVALTQRAGASIGAIAREHGVHPSALSKWRSFLSDENSADSLPRKTPRKTAPPVAFMPVTIQSEEHLVAASSASSVHIALPSGVVLRIETPQLDTEVLCALLAQVQR